MKNNQLNLSNTITGKREISGYVKLQINGGQANPAPPVGPALGQRGINIMEFCKAFNEKTKNFMGKPVPVVITVYKDKKFDFIIKSPPASHFIKEAAKLKSGSQEPGRNIVASITKKQAEEIAKKKMVDLNAHDLEEAVKIIAGSARSMGIEVKD
jgi:large subunit ribosomal protein L11